jgi:DNA-binding NtrC family response regulator
VETLDDRESREHRDEPPVPGVVMVFTASTAIVRSRRIHQRELLGRADVEDLPEPDPRLSRDHAEVRLESGEWCVRDLQSRNGTFVGGAQVSGEVRFRGDAVVRAGHTLYLLRADVRPFEQHPISVDDHEVIGPTLAAIRNRIAALARAGAPLLITGESGTGKELAARHYHASGRPSGAPFIAVNCATIPDGIAERLLFGARRGAFSGADANVDGFAAAAHGGTLFLDEIGDLSLLVQAKLLRLLESAEIVPLGANRGQPVDVRFCAATHHSLVEAVATRQFRDDLFYRIGRPEIALPPLRERVEEIPSLITRAFGRAGLTPSARFVEACCLRPWPGNVRELLHELQRIVAEARATGASVVSSSQLHPLAGLPVVGDRVEPRRDPSREEIERALASSNRNVSAAARTLGLHRTQLYRAMERLGMSREKDD